MKKNLKSLDFLLYLSSFVSLILIVLLLTSSKSISYNIDKAKIIPDQENQNIYTFTTIENTEYEKDLLINEEKEAETTKEASQEKIKEETIVEKPELLQEAQRIKLKKAFPAKIGVDRAEPVKKIEKGKTIQYYTVRKGDNLWRISRKFNTDIYTILESNKIKNPNIIYQGQKIKIVLNQKQENFIIQYNNNPLHSREPVTKSIMQEKRKFKFTWPLRGRISSEFGVRKSPYSKKMEFHPGIDIVNKLGKNFAAAESGKVIFSGVRGGYGRIIIIEHRKGYKTRYGHVLISYVKTGEYVKKSQIIGRVGNTGLSTGPHLHFEVRKNNIALDPASLINTRLLFY